MSLWRILSERASKQPDAPAILAPRRRPLRFGELPGRLEAIRAKLTRCGIGCGDVVATALPDGAETAVCLLGLMSCAIAAPLNPNYSEGEFGRYLSRLHPKALIVCGDGGDAARRQAHLLKIPTIELVADSGAAAGSFELRSDLNGTPTSTEWNADGDTGFILLTSGSTGRPKFVPYTIRRIIAAAKCFAQTYQIGPSDTSIHLMPIFHGHGINRLASSLLSGSGIVFPGPFDVPTFFACIEEFKPTWFTAGYTMHRAILDQADKYRETANAARVRFIRSGSGRLDPHIIRGLEEIFGAPVIDRYGASESGELTTNPLPPGIRKPGKVGIPGANEVRIIDPNGAFLGTNQEGEIVARGPTVFDGYWDDPEATAAAFMRDWYRTGDLGRFDEDGYLEITGRIKDLINRGGEKISPLEVEAVLAEHPAVNSACVFAVPHTSLGEEVAAAVVLRKERYACEQELLAHLRARLVPFKVPRRVLFLEALPKSGTGKISRSEVAQLCLGIMAQSQSAAGTKRPRKPSRLEQQILEIWNDVLKSDMPDLDKDFFLAGGDSLRAADLLARIRRRFGVMLGLGQMFDDTPTVAGLARLIEFGRTVRAESRDSSGLVPVKSSGNLPPIFAVPGRDGNPFAWVHLARALSHRQPLYLLEYQGLDGRRPPLDSVPGIAALHIRSIRKLQPAGPYYLMGACFGARVAFEMARQLRAGGSRVGLLIMLDPSAPFTDSQGRPRAGHKEQIPANRNPTVPRYIVDRFTFHARQITNLRGEARRAYLRQKMKHMTEIVRQRDVFRGNRSGLYEQFQRAVEEANLRAGRRYIPAPYDGDAVLCIIKKDRPSAGHREFRLDWMQLLPRCDHPVFIDGENAWTIMNASRAPRLASQIETWLEAARGEVHGSITKRAEVPSMAIL